MRPSSAISLVVASSLPAVLAATAYVPYAFNTSHPEIHGLPIAANSLAFWIGKPTTAVCPSYDTDCPSENTTIITGPTFNSVGGGPEDGVFWMGILADGGQAIYSNIPGLMQYSAVGTNNAASTTKPSYGPFYVEQDDEVGGPVLRFTGVNEDTGGFVACASDGAYSVLSYAFGGEQGQAGPCYQFQMQLVETTAPAVEYYD